MMMTRKMASSSSSSSSPSSWFKFISSPSKLISGRHRKERVNNLGNKLNVNEEYKAALRSNSYIEMCNRVHEFDDSLLEPRQETLFDIIKDSNLHRLLVNYFEASFEAYNICELLLRDVNQTRANYCIIHTVIKKMSKTVHRDEGETAAADNKTNYSIIHNDLASFALLKNPLSSISPFQFRDTHKRHSNLVTQLKSKCRKIKRKTKFLGWFKKVAGYSLVLSCGVLAIILLALAFHSAVGLVATPALLLPSSVVFFKKRSKLDNCRKMMTKTGSLERLGEQFDEAAKGVYTLINDFNTMSRLVRRLADEVDHERAVADLCVRNMGSDEVLKEVVREFWVDESCFLEQLEELEEHIYLCFLTINRSRRLVVEEILVNSATAEV